jgi:hypothetical protein
MSDEQEPFTVHEVTRDGTPSERVLLRTAFHDVATFAALGLANQRYGENSESVLRILDVGMDLFVICNNGRIDSYVELQSYQRNRWGVRTP